MPPDLEASTAPAGAPESHQLDFPPVRNGIDYLVSVVDHLTRSEVGPREIKYAVLHLQAATEVLLKARLVREHWSLVFDSPSEATDRAFRSGDFKSCTINEAVTRLRNIAGVHITNKELDALKDLGRDRNALQHYGLTHNARALEARAGRVLDFLVRFLDDALLPDFDQEERNSIGADMVQVRNGLDGVHTFITQRRRRLRGELKGLESRTTECDQCHEMALVTDGETVQCHFCGHTWVALTPWIMELYTRDKGHPERCPECEAQTMVPGVRLASESVPVRFCFSCTARVSSPPAEPIEPSR
ncbi:hypothetical protein [Streptomyces rishiriensis]|uniref:hypothetical protein n=1 Tax=Streptomyces rishiriensis TaxID=68264 RepID=UPI000D58E89B|nr:hypothetical protein [Streptomyces rishiriensis]